MRALRLALLLAAALAAPAAAQPAPPSAARDLPRGHVLAADDVVWPDGAPRAADAGDAVAPGWIARRAIREGEPLREPAVAPPPVVRAGEAVALVWRQGAMELRVRGVALGDAVAGQRVAVRVDTRRRLEGTAQANGLVVVTQHEMHR